MVTEMCVNTKTTLPISLVSAANVRPKSPELIIWKVPYSNSAVFKLTDDMNVTTWDS